MEGKKKKYCILYFNAHEYTASDAIETLKTIGHDVTELTIAYEKYDEDTLFMEAANKALLSKAYDCIFSFNYYPDLSRVAEERGVLYLAWCFDAALYTLKSITLKNSCNRVFLFDYSDYMQLKEEGFHNVYYMPLACNTKRMTREWKTNVYEHDISFVGNLYEGETDFFSQIKYLPEYLSGYLEAVVNAQLQVYGMDLIDCMMNAAICEEMGKYVAFELGNNYRECKNWVLSNMVKKHATAIERRAILTTLGENYQVDLYTTKKPLDLPVRYLGYADYIHQMPIIFQRSKINLNITLRSIPSGISLRVIDVLGAGGFCLTNYQMELAEYYENGKDLVWYESREDLLEKVAYYLRHDAERERIAYAGHEKAKALFSYEIVFPRIFDLAFHSEVR